MGLREKVALAINFFILTQILCVHCMPRCHSNFARSFKNINSTEFCSDRPNKMPIKDASNFTSLNNSVVVTFPGVEYPSSSQPGEYYRFQNDYPSELPLYCINNSSSQAWTYKRESKLKRKYAASNKPKPETTIMVQDPLPKPYCLEEGLFPEVEYPLSARDMWLPKHWSPLHDSKRNNQIEASKCSTKATQFSNDANDDSFKLNNLIKALNAEIKENLGTPNSDSTSNYTVRDDKSRTSSVSSSYIKPVLTIPQNEPTIDIKTINTSALLTFSGENQGSEENFFLMITTPNNTDVNSEPSISINNSIGDMVTSKIPSKITDSSVINAELSIAEKNQSTYDEVLPEQSSNEHDANNGDIITTAIVTNASENKLELNIPEENQSTYDNSAKIINNVTVLSNISETNNTCCDIVTTTFNSDDSNIFSQQLILDGKEASCDNIATDATTDMNGDIIPELLKTSFFNGYCDIATMTTNTCTSEITSQLPISEDTQGCRDNSVSIFCCSDNLTIKKNTDISDIVLQLSVTNQNESSSDNNIVPKVLSVTDSDKTPEPFIQCWLGEYGNNSNISVINTDNINTSHLPMLSIIEEHSANFTASNVDADEKNNPEVFPNNTQDNYSSLNTHTDAGNKDVDAGNFEYLSVAENPDDCWLILYDTENMTEDNPVNDYEAVYFLTKINTNDGPVSVLEDAVDLIVFNHAQNPNSTLQLSYINNTYTFYNETQSDEMWYPEFGNDIYFTNNTCEVCEPVFESYNDTCMFFTKTYDDNDFCVE